MATASSSDDQMLCYLCLNVFHNPRCLLCGHSFCTKCLHEHINTNYQINDRQITCPYCMQEVQIPDSSKPVESWAAQFPVNISLQEAISKLERSKMSGKGGHISVLSSVSESLKTFREILQSEMDEKIEKLRQDVDINVVETTEEVKMIGNKLILEFTDAVHKEEDRLIKEIEKSVNLEIEKMFTEHKHLIEENEKLIKLGEHLLKSDSESEIKTNIPKFTELQNTTSKFLAKSLSKIDKAKVQINLRKCDKKKEMSVDIGEIYASIQTDTGLERLTDTCQHTNTINTTTQNTDTQIYKLTDTLKHTDTINTTTQQIDTQIDRLTDKLKHKDTINTTTHHTDTQIDRLTDTLKHTDTINTTTQQIDTQIDRLTDTLKHTDTINTTTHHTDTINTTTHHTDTQIDKLTDTLKYTDTINTKTQKDMLNPWLFSILVSGEDNSKIVVSDYNNECVKCFCLERKSVINKHATSSQPCGVAEFRDPHGVAVVVTLPFKKKILFLNLENFKLIKTITTDKQYFFVVVLPGNRLAVTGLYSGQYLDILTDNGQLINSFSEDLIPKPACLTVHDQCLTVVSKTESVNSLFCMTSSGDVKWMSRDSDRLRDLRGVTCDREGNIFVCDFRRNCVVQLLRNGKFLRDVLTDQDGLSGPWSVCCHGNTLYVTQNTGEIKTFTWCKT